MIMPAALLTELFRIELAHFHVEMGGGVWMLISSFISFALLTVILLLMLRVPRWRIVVTLSELLVSSFMSWAVYGLYRA
jgi:hypothetical protein